MSVKVEVHGNNIEQAIRTFKRRLQREGVFRKAKSQRFYVKPSVKNAEAKAESARRVRKLVQKKREED